MAIKTEEGEEEGIVRDVQPYGVWPAFCISVERTGVPVSLNEKNYFRFCIPVDKSPRNRIINQIIKGSCGQNIRFSLDEDGRIENAKIGHVKVFDRRAKTETESANIPVRKVLDRILKLDK